MDEITTTRKTKNLTSIKQRQMSLFWGVFWFFQRGEEESIFSVLSPFPAGGQG